MATNRKYASGRYIPIAIPAGTASGDPIVVGQIAGVSLKDIDGDGNGVIDTEGVYNLSVKGADAEGSNALGLGAIIYHASGSTPPLTGINTGVRFGTLLEAVASGATSTVAVRLGY